MIAGLKMLFPGVVVASTCVFVLVYCCCIRTWTSHGQTYGRDFLSRHPYLARMMQVSSRSLVATREVSGSSGPAAK